MYALLALLTRWLNTWDHKEQSAEEARRAEDTMSRHGYL